MPHLLGGGGLEALFCAFFIVEFKGVCETELPAELQLMLVSQSITLDLPFCPSHITADESLLCVITRSLCTVCLVQLSDLTCTVVEPNVSADCLKRNPLVYMLPFRSVGTVGSLFSIFDVHEHRHGSQSRGFSWCRHIQARQSVLYPSQSACQVDCTSSIMIF